jgi:hypothetical protein
MQLRQQFIPNAAKFVHAFSRDQKRNRVELVSDFPVGNDAEVVCSLQVSTFIHNIEPRFTNGFLLLLRSIRKVGVRLVETSVLTKVQR